MKYKSLFRLTFWKSVALIIVATGLYSTYFRIVDGLGAVTNLNDAFPWGLWIGFDILCGVGLAAGGFTICAITHIFNLEKFKPLARPAILTAFLGYVLVIFALMFDLGRPYNIWHALIMWNPHSVMFEVAWCVMLYTTVLFLEFSPIILERFKLKKIHSFLKKYLIPIMILGIILSTLHQSSLGSLYLIIPQKMHPLWYSSLLPIYFYLSAIGVGFAMVVFEAYLSARAFNHGLKLDLLSSIAKVTFAVLIISFIIRLFDLTISGKLNYLITPSYETYMFYLEIIVGTFVPVALLGNSRIRTSRLGLYISAIFVIAGFLLNRLNVSVTSLTSYAGYAYFPSVSEISITLMIVVLGMWAFSLIVKNFPVFAEPHEIKNEVPVSSGNIILSE
ncbi:MAG: Ni/Fe-hydrogenase cytochrome b subunit [Ignavibacteriales bacterium]|nr:MAG: Ni/Fe-hydrogenase cytochrome b subunit [Ignavibacteriales bacterium]